MLHDCLGTTQHSASAVLFSTHVSSFVVVVLNAAILLRHVLVALLLWHGCCSLDHLHELVTGLHAEVLPHKQVSPQQGLAAWAGRTMPAEEAWQ